MLWSGFFLCFPIPPFFFQTFEDHSKCCNYNWYHSHPPQVLQFIWGFFCSLARFKYFIIILHLSLQLVSPSPSTALLALGQDSSICLFSHFLFLSVYELQNTLDNKFFSSYQLIIGLVFWMELSNPLISQSPRTVISIYHIYLTPPLGQDMTQGQFF